MVPMAYRHYLVDFDLMDKIGNLSSQNMGFSFVVYLQCLERICCKQRFGIISAKQTKVNRIVLYTIYPVDFAAKTGS